MRQVRRGNPARMGGPGRRCLRRCLHEIYYDDPAFRNEIGPNIELHGDDNGVYETLFGLQIDVDLGSLGIVRGIVQECEKDLEIEWRCGPDHKQNTSFVTKHEDSDTILRLYFQGRNVPSWMDEERPSTKAALEFVRSLAAAPDGTKLVDWKQPYDVEELEKDYDEDRWQMTMNRLNDPRMAHHYGCEENAVPTPIVLLFIAVCAANCSSTRLPTIVTKEKEPVYEKVDYMCRFVNGSRGGRVGYGQLMGLEKLIKKIKSDFPAKKLKKDIDTWRAGYNQAQALMLLLSDEFEESICDYIMVCDLDRLANLVADILGVFITFMSPSLVLEPAKETLANELEFNAKHLAAGSFVSIAEEDAEMKELFDKFKLCMQRPT